MVPGFCVSECILQLYHPAEGARVARKPRAPAETLGGAGLSCPLRALPTLQVPEKVKQGCLG